MPLTNLDGTKGLIYHKKTGAVTSEASDRKIGSCSVLSIREYPMRIIAYFPKNILNVDNNYIEEKIFENISNAIQANNPKTLRSALKATRVDIITKNFSADRQRILSEEIKNYDLRLPTEWAVISIDYTVTIEASERCFEQWACNDVRETPQFYFPKNFTCEQLTNANTGLTDLQKECVLPTIPCDILTDEDILTDAQIACLQAAFGGECPDADITINATPFGVAPSGETTVIPVVNTDLDPVGSKIGTDWVVPNGIAQNSLGAQVASAPSGAIAVVNDSAVTDGNGTVNQVPATNSFTCQRHIEVSFTSDVQEATAGSTVVTFTATVGAGTVTTWLWNFGDGNTSTSQNPTHTYANSGDYTVTVTGSNANPASGAFTRTAYIHVYQSESIALFARFTGTPTDARKRIIDNKIVADKAANYWANRSVEWVIAAHDSQASTRNWKENDNNLTYVNGLTPVTDRGITSNGTNQYAQTGWIPSTDGGTLFTLNDNYICVYVGTNVALTAGDIGVLNAASTNGTTIISRNTGTDNYMTRNNAQTQTNTAGATDSRGFIMLIRTSSASYNLYKNGVFVANIATASQALATLELYICTINNNGAVGTFSTRRIQYVAAGKGVGIDPLHYYNIVQTYMTAIGANV